MPVLINKQFLPFMLLIFNTISFGPDLGNLPPVFQAGHNIVTDI